MSTQNVEALASDVFSIKLDASLNSNLLHAAIFLGPVDVRGWLSDSLEGVELGQSVFRAHVLVLPLRVDIDHLLWFVGKEAYVTLEVLAAYWHLRAGTKANGKMISSLVVPLLQSIVMLM